MLMLCRPAASVISRVIKRRRLPSIRSIGNAANDVLPAITGSGYNHESGSVAGCLINWTMIIACYRQ